MRSPGGGAHTEAPRAGAGAGERPWRPRRALPTGHARPPAGSAPPTLLRCCLLAVGSRPTPAGVSIFVHSPLSRTLHPQSWSEGTDPPLALQEEEQEQDSEEEAPPAEPEEDDGGEAFFKYSPGKLRGSQYKRMMTKEELEEEQRIELTSDLTSL
ncbi:PREDICTED: matrix-remodeling-associated protein 7 isoform X2 [Myotis davidii]|uniref:matrix-remodeling-associated protein 7 isoform X2 n=1 Tax=Myotis davidii TaxID=225400 RepID=UPI000766E264|nr:PREDICTED: matrix-remodeling-associated protein 7 isoform X2 [Myotis davidii]XP_015414727.1 PREDICTED: matrix-remodeling-associated protein 7 isoform X2 [Myotis davidii]